MTQVPTALLLDEDLQFGEAIATELARRGIRLVQARRGDEVAAALAGNAPDLYVVDALLPDGGGLGWIEALRARDPRTPVVFVSSFWQDLRSFSRLRNDLGVAMIAQKPVAPSVFAEQVRALLPEAEAPEPDEGVPAELLELRRAYAAGLPGEVAALATASLDLRSGALGRARLEAHRLRGTAGSYGFRRVSALAGEIEDTIVAHLANPEVGCDLSGPLAALEQAAAEEASAVGPAPAPAPAAASGRVLALGLPGPVAEQLRGLGTAAGLEIEVAAGWTSGMRSARSRPPEVVIFGREDVTEEEVLALATELHADLDPSVILVGAGDGGLDARVAVANAGVSRALPAGTDGIAILAAARELVQARLAERPAVLVVDDDRAFASHVCAVLRASGVRADAIDDARLLLDALHATRPDALLLDLVMPGFGGLDLCRMLRSMPEWQDLPILLVTAQTDPATRLAGFQAGADDHVPKPILPEELVARIGVRVERRRLLRERADRDMLTGLGSRRAFLDALESRLSDTRRHGRALSFIVLDLDHFKRVNDEHGHLVGDNVLASLGALLARRLRREDLRCRWGGEEIAIALSEQDAEVAAGVARQLLREFSAVAFEGAAGERFFASFSAGVASSPADGDSIRTLFDAADRRCYAAKTAGRARVVASDGARSA